MKLSSARVAAVIPAAGAGKRLGTKRAKPLVWVGGKPLFIHTLEALQTSFRFSDILLVVAAREEKRIKSLLIRHGFKNVRVVRGGSTRAESVRNGVMALSKNTDWVLIHDAARPLVTKVLVNRVLRDLARSQAVIPVLPVNATVKKMSLKGKTILGTEDRRELFLAQTPQVFRKGLLVNRYRQLGDKALLATDEAALFDGSRTRVKAVLGDPRNIKITTKDDLELAEFYLRFDRCG